MKILPLAFLLAFVGKFSGWQSRQCTRPKLSAFRYMYLRLADVNSAQDCGSTIAWEPAPYQTARESLSDPNGTPQGFRRDIVIPNPERMVKAPCVTYTIQDPIQYVEVLVRVYEDTV